MAPIIAAIDRLAAALAVAGAWAGAAILASVTALILLEIVLRSFFGRSTQILEEYVGYGLGAMIFLGLGHALRQGALVRVDLLLGALGPMTRRIFEILVCTVTLPVMLFLMNYFLISVQRNYRQGTISMTVAATPIWIPEAIVLTGMAIFTLQVVVYALRLIAGGPLVEDLGRID